MFNKKRIKELEDQVKVLHSDLEKKRKESVEANSLHLQEMLEQSKKHDDEKEKILTGSNKRFSEIIAKYYLVSNINPAFSGINITDQFLDSLTEDESVLVDMYFKDYEILKLDQITKLLSY